MTSVRKVGISPDASRDVRCPLPCGRRVGFERQRVPTMSTSPLDGVRVVSLAPNLPGPAAAMHFTRLGAQVTKVEPRPRTREGRQTPAG